MKGEGRTQIYTGGKRRVQKETSYGGGGVYGEVVRRRVALLKRGQREHRMGGGGRLTRGEGDPRGVSGGLPPAPCFGCFARRGQISNF